MSNAPAPRGPGQGTAQPRRDAPGREEAAGLRALSFPASARSGEEPMNCDEGDSPQLYHSIFIFSGGGGEGGTLARPSPGKPGEGRRQRTRPRPPRAPSSRAPRPARRPLRGPRRHLAAAEQKEASALPGLPHRAVPTHPREEHGLHGTAAPSPSRRAAGRGGRGGPGPGCGGAPPHPETPRPGGWLWGARL